MSFADANISLASSFVKGSKMSVYFSKKCFPSDNEEMFSL